MEQLPRQILFFLSMAFATALGLTTEFGLRHFNQPDAVVESEASLASILYAAVPGTASAAVAPPVEAIALTVDGTDVVGVANEEAARSVTEQILAEYKESVLKDAASIEQVAFLEEVAYRPKLIPPGNVRTVAEAIRILKHGTDKLATYVVKPGDNSWDIARSFNVDTEQLARANPTIDIELLQIDQLLNVTFREPYVHTRSVSIRVATEWIPFAEEYVKDPNLWPWQTRIAKPGVGGSRELTLREQREQGQLVKREVLKSRVLKQPNTQVVQQGTKQIPAIGTGSLVYPTVGVTTSYFGPRWGGFHNGVDIAAKTGTPVLAADSGIVVFARWDGNYGNLIKIDHGGGKMVTWYAHLSDYAVGVGATVAKGETIGWVGNTGYSTGPHLHYEVRVNQLALNPFNFYR